MNYEPKEYVLLEGRTADQLTDQVNNHLRDGWRLSGIVSCAMAIQSAAGHPAEGAPYLVFTQAMVR
jgi:hypothetical protein